MSDAPENVYMFDEPARAAYVWLVEPKKRERWKAEPRYELTVMMDPEDANLKAIKKLMAKVAKAEFGSLDGVEFPLKDGTKEADAAKAKGKDQEWKRGQVLLATHSNTKNGKGEPVRPPSLWLLKNGQYIQFDETERKNAGKVFYPGVLVRPKVAVVAYGEPTKRVSVYLNDAISLGVGDKLKIGVDPEERFGKAEKFSKYTGTVSTEDPTSGMEDDDEIPF